MEPFEWLLIGTGLAAVGLLGAKGKTALKSATKGYLALEEKARDWTSTMRKDVGEAVEEARRERAHEILAREQTRQKPQQEISLSASGVDRPA